ncbi:M23 family metallopeptidase [Bacillus salipaludis]|uniref:M23 family metallopeptidase n=1 Tax=Bacillus salipaludis TaxID=2547811 RepID=A0A4R5VZL9_9BACI|nr:M23 family metallopeptidase [Bacillus salipaludis]MDQ6595111.1 M23 family metallopeptidase [Bacillus salipaludis]TDK64027.1 M23 family metallopeptidase [Bacillus salipaludis]
MREEENKRSSQKSFFKKRWVFPAIYIASAAIILTGVLWYTNLTSSTKDNKATDIAQKKFNEPSVEVNKAMENFKMPVANSDTAVIEKKFYDFKASKEEQVAALVHYNNQYVPNTGIDITMKNGETFDVVAALSGTVTKVNEDATLGNVIEIEHEKGVVTQYSSVNDMKVKVGEQVKQGEVIAKAGQSLFNEKAGTHVHFEIRKDDVPVNPDNYFNKTLSALQEENTTPAADTTEKVTEDKANNQKIDDSTKTPDDQKIDDSTNTQDDQGTSSEEDGTPSDSSSDTNS